MKLIVGLGNPGKEYENTRHNAGFMAVDKLAEMLNVEFSKTQFNSLIATTQIKDEKVMLMKPLTYMNLSGEAVYSITQYYKIETYNILVLHDDLDLPVGKIRIRYQGSSGGQKGLKNIIDLLHTQDIKRIRIGIDKNPMIPIVDYVLGKIPEDQKEEFNKSLEKAAKAAKASLTMNFIDVMTRYNR